MKRILNVRGFSKPLTPIYTYNGKDHPDVDDLVEIMRLFGEHFPEYVVVGAGSGPFYESLTVGKRVVRHGQKKRLDDSCIITEGVTTVGQTFTMTLSFFMSVLERMGQLPDFVERHEPDIGQDYYDEIVLS